MATTEHELRACMLRYGHNRITEQEQIELLRLILADTKAHCTEQQRDIDALISHYQLRLEQVNILDRAIKLVNECIIELEEKNTGKTILSYLKQQGVFRILYRNPLIKGQELAGHDVLHKLLRYGFIGVVVSALILVFFVTTALLASPVWLTTIASALFVGASVYLSGMLYGVVNDLFATHANLPYFLLGHQPQQTSLLRTNDKVTQGIAWGIAATFVPVAIAAVLFTVVTLVTAIFVPIATFILPILMLAMPLIAVGAEFYARSKIREYLEYPESEFNGIGSNGYQRQGLNFMSPTPAERAAWYANSDRNMFGFTKVPLIGLGALIALVILSSISIFLPPALFFSPIIATLIPVACAAVISISLLASGIYMYAKRNSQLDDRYRLEFSRDRIEPSLYLDEDSNYINGLIRQYRPQDVNSTVHTMSRELDGYNNFWQTEPAMTQEEREQPKVNCLL